RNRANLRFQKGNFREAELLCEQALEWASMTGESELRATILNTLGAIQSATGNHADAIKTLGLCLADFRTARNRSREGYVLLNIGLAE
ncbi:tetratricopeptide repeat protein, partial [Klebsiella pneumoniae]|nr:tetratricopeptide repeat protein [Klebsiella pneumoniae]